MLSAIVLFSLALVVFGGKPDQEIHLSRAKWDTMLLNYADERTDREKRAFINFAKLGIETLRKLLTGAKPVYSSGKKFRNYEKEGDLSTALRDFYSVRPVKIEEKTTSQGVKVLKARSGDRSLSLQTVSFKGFPILDVIDYKNKRRGERYIDRIMYKTPEIKKNEKNSGN